MDICSLIIILLRSRITLSNIIITEVESALLNKAIPSDSFLGLYSFKIVHGLEELKGSGKKIQSI